MSASPLGVPPKKDRTRVVNPLRTILVVDEEESTRRLLQRVLDRENFRLSWSRFGTDAVNQAVESRPDVIVLETDLPHTDGLHVLRALRRWTRARVIVLSWRSGIGDKVRALDAGAEDYIVKPFDPDELAARIRVVLRCEPLAGDAPSTVRGNLKINRTSGEMIFNGVRLELTDLERAVLFILARHAGKLVPQKRLIRAVWAMGAARNVVRQINNQIGNLRRKLTAYSGSDPVQGEASYGYRLALIVTWEEPFSHTNGTAPTLTRTPSSLRHS